MLRAGRGERPQVDIEDLTCSSMRRRGLTRGLLRLGRRAPELSSLSQERGVKQLNFNSMCIGQASDRCRESEPPIRSSKQHQHVCRRFTTCTILRTTHSMNSLAPLRCLRAPLVKRQPVSQPSVTLALQQTSAFSSTENRQKRNKGGPKKDARISMYTPAHCNYLPLPITVVGVKLQDKC